MTVTIAPMTEAHIELLMPYEHEMFGADSWTVDSYRDELNDTELRHYLVALAADGSLLGWGGTLTIAETAQLLTIGVIPPAQRTGIATQLLRALLVAVREQGAEECILEVREDNAPARAFYDREGFTRLRLRRGYYDNGRGNAIEMRLDLRRVAEARA